MLDGLYWFFLWSLAIGASMWLIFCVDPNDKGILGTCRSFIFDVIPYYIEKVGVKIFGPKFSYYLGKVFKYIFKENNCIVQIMYIMIGPGGFMGYVYYGIMEHLPNRYVGFGPIYATSFLAFMCFYIYYKACSTNPGIITQKNVKHYLKKYDKFYDGNIFMRNNKCKTCELDKPARSKHCTVCNNCVSKFDHHCIWIKGCVGEKNYKWFLMFIGAHALLTVIGSLVAILIFYDIVQSKKLLEANFRSMKTGEVFSATYYTVWQYLLQKYGGFFFVSMLCVIMALALTGFFFYHLSLVNSGFTTNEKIKKGNLISNIDYYTNLRNNTVAKVAPMDVEQYETYRASWMEKEQKKLEKKQANGQDVSDSVDPDKIPKTKEQLLESLNDDLYTLRKTKKELTELNFSAGFFVNLKTILNS